MDGHIGHIGPTSLVIPTGAWMDKHIGPTSLVIPTGQAWIIPTHAHRAYIPSHSPRSMEHGWTSMDGHIGPTSLVIPTYRTAWMDKEHGWTGT